MKKNKARRAENFSGTEQNSSIIRVSEQNFEQNKRFLRALPAGIISHFTSRIYPSLVQTHLPPEGEMKLFSTKSPEFPL